MARSIALSACHGRAEWPARPRKTARAVTLPTQPAWTVQSVGSSTIASAASWASRDRFLGTNAGAPRWRDLPEILAGLGRGALDPEGGFFPLLLLLLPFVAAARPLRPAALVLAAQLALYLVLYLLSPVDLDLLLRVSAHRLLSHLVPAALLLAVLRVSAPAFGGGRTEEPRLGDSASVSAPRRGGCGIPTEGSSTQ